MPDQYDVAIIGGRVAGSSLAVLLAQAGFRVLLLERVEFPSDTLSTHLIYGDSFGVWEEIGAWAEIQRLGVAELAGITWIRDGKPDIRGNFWPVRGHPYAMCIRRLLLDEVLFKNAADTPGVTAIENARARDLIEDNGRVAGLTYSVRGSSATGEFKAHATLTVGCDGRKSFLARRVGAVPYHEIPPLYFAFYTYVGGVDPGPEPRPMFELWDSEAVGGTAMLAKCDGDIWMTIAYLPQSEFEEFRLAKEANFWRRMESDPRIGPRLKVGEQLMPVKGAGDLSNFFRTPVGPGWALVGDSGQHKDPIYGQGIGDAVRSAELLATELKKVASGEKEWASALASFHALRDLDLLPNYKWMIKGQPTDLSGEQFNAIMENLGSDPESAEEFVNIFSHAVSAEEFFGRVHAARLLDTSPAMLDNRSIHVSES